MSNYKIELVGLFLGLLFLALGATTKFLFTDFYIPSSFTNYSMIGGGVMILLSLLILIINVFPKEKKD